MEKVDFLITTMDRYNLLEELLDSIFVYYPNAIITIADQSKDINTEFYMKWKDRNLRVFPLPYDCGLSFARNVLVKETKQPYKLILEDDFLFTHDTVIEKMLALVDVGDIIGGAVIKDGRRLKFEHYFKKEFETIYQIPDWDLYEFYNGIKFKKTGCVLNFFLAKEIVFEDTLWHNELKLREHQHFFYRVKNKIVFTPEVKIIDNKKNNSRNYQALKGRDEFWKIALEDLGAKKFKYQNGNCVEIEGDKIIRYRENSLNIAI
jgi:glycosyltransferase involved in cell wall biosynthesis